MPDPRALYDRLLPYADLLVVAGMGTACRGSAHLVLAELARRLGDEDAARAHAAAARPAPAGGRRISRGTTPSSRSALR
ncbi:hypothetical protein ACWEJ6_28135 [Nonomuraea sp. NPDC004702]